MTIDQNALKAEIQAEYDADPKHYKTKTRYVIKRIESEYKERESTVIPRRGDATLVAIKEVQPVMLDGTPVTGAATTLEGHIREDVQINYASRAEIRSQQKLALVMDYGKKATFRFTGGSAISVTLPDTAFPQVSVGQYLKATVRGQDPVTRGVRSVTKTSNDTQSTYCRFEARVDEKVLQTSTAGGTLASAEGVEWAIQSGERASVDYQTTSSGPVLTLNEAQFALKVMVGDFIRLDARTGDSGSIAAAGAGYYRVTEVGDSQLRMTKEQFDRPSEGVYDQDAAVAVNFTGTCDFTVVRAVREPVYLRHATKTFQGVAAGDWVRTAYTLAGTPQSVVWKVKEVPAPGLLLFDRDMYVGTQAPYTLNNQVDPGSHFTAIATYGIYRAPENRMATFKVTDTRANFTAFVQPGDYVTLLNRTGGLDATQSPAKVPGTYRVASVPSATVLNLENRRYELQNGDFAPVGYFYDNLTDVASYEIRRFLILYPYATLYRISGVSAETKTIELEPRTYAGYGGYAGDYREEATPLPPFEDVMDFEVLQTFTDKLFLIDPAADFTSKLAAGDFVHLVRRTVSPATQIADTTGIFKVESIPHKTVVFLDRTRYQGNEPFYQDSGSRLATNNYRDDCDYRATRVFASEYSRVLLTHPDPVFASVAAGDFLVMKNPSGSNPVGPVLRVEAKLSDRQLKLATDVRYVEESGRYKPSGTPPVAYFEIKVDFEVTRYATNTTLLEIRSAGLESDPINGAYYQNGQLGPIKDIAKVSYFAGGVERNQIFAVVLAYDGVVKLYPTLVTGSSGNYQLSANRLAEDFESPVTFEIIRAVSDLDDVLAELDILRTIIPSAEVGKIDRVYDSILPRQNRVASASLSTVRVICDQFYMADDVLNQPVPVHGRPTPLRPSEARLELPVSESDALTLLKLPIFQQAAAIGCVIDFAGVYTPKKLADLKDLWVDAKLRERGYKAMIASINKTSNLDAKQKAPLIAVQSAGLAMSLKIRESVEDALRQRKRPDLISSVGAQLDNFLALLSIDDAMWVRDGKISVAPGVGLLLPGIDLPEAVVKRKAVQAKIGVPADRSVRSLKRSHSIKKNRRKFYEKNADDLRRHRDSATDPGIAQLIGDWIAGLTAKRDQELGAETMEANELQDRGSEGAEVDLTSPDDLQRLGDRLQDINPTMSTGAMGDNFMLAANPTGVASDAGGGSAAEEDETVPSVSQVLNTSGNITNRFQKDFQDFRRTGITLPLHALNQGSGESNRGLLAHIRLTKSNGVPTGTTFDLGDAGQTYDPEYNNFILTGVQEQHVEKYQVMDTLSKGWVAFAFGQQPEVWSIQGVLINDTFSDQLVRFRSLFEEYLRITKLAERDQKLQISIPGAGIVIWGYGLVFAPMVESGQNETVVPFTMQVLVSGWKPMPMFRYIEGNTAIQALPKLVSQTNRRAVRTSLMRSAGATDSPEAPPSRGEQYGPPPPPEQAAAAPSGGEQYGPPPPPPPPPPTATASAAEARQQNAEKHGPPPPPTQEEAERMAAAREEFNKLIRYRSEVSGFLDQRYDTVSQGKSGSDAAKLYRRYQLDKSHLSKVMLDTWRGNKNRRAELERIHEKWKNMS